ncbi:hypothetical protein GCM10009347_42520 [Shewanella algicola]|uniref:H repeat-associated protein N-terminal domain-containing protein n=1 Tax=Shewanella saliphila TaxID=2282698 RepID=A0ABQ2QB23_9GAMM|nr:hypothetical protein GCM10009409_38520 [Shewanella saliphila]GGP73709.1 hypothetical protein GCM10009347_42520 [Shewanella algicola]
MTMSTTFLTHFNSITDPRIERCKKHQLIDILLLAICAVLSEAEGGEDIEDFDHLKLDWLKNTVLSLVVYQSMTPSPVLFVD